MVVVFLKILVVFAISFLGAILHRTKKLDVPTISNLILYLGSPSLVFVTILRNQYFLGDIFSYILSMVLLILLVGVLTKIFFFKIIKTKPIIYLTTMFMNTANMGFPLTIILLGEKAFSIAIIFDLTMVLLLFTLGVSLVDKNSGYFGGFKLPVIYAAGLAFFLSYFQINVPTIIFSTIGTLGSITIPLMLIVLGARLSDVKIWEFKLKRSFQIVILRALGGGAVGLVLSGTLVLSPLARKVFILYSILPSPMMSFVLAQKYGKDDILAAESVLVGTLLAMIYIPIVMRFV